MKGIDTSVAKAALRIVHTVLYRNEEENNSSTFRKRPGSRKQQMQFIPT